MMSDIILKPEVRTPGGEATSIYYGTQWVGDMYLVYREHDILTGTVNFDPETVSTKEVHLISDKINQYVKHLGNALEVNDEDVNIVYGSPVGLIDTRSMNNDEEITGFGYQPDEIVHEEWVYPEIQNEVTMKHYYSDETSPLHLSIVGEVGESIFYDVMDEREDMIAEAIFDGEDEGVEISVNFLVQPSKKVKKWMIRKLTREALSLDYEWLNLRMNYHGDSVGGFHIQRG
jgi:hypothetical protein